MSIPILLSARPGGSAVAFRPNDQTSPYPASDILGVSLVAATLANLATPRKGQVMVLDRIDQIAFDLGVGGQYYGGFLRTHDALSHPTNTSGQLLWLPFMSLQSTGTNQSRRINDIGYVVPENHSLGFGVNVAGWSDDIAAHIRYRDFGGIRSGEIRQGKWGSVISLQGVGETHASPTELLPAPGVGYHYRIRTIMMRGAVSAADAAVQSLTLGDNATPTSSIIFQWHSALVLNDAAIEVYETNLDIPCKENAPVVLSWADNFHVGCIIGAEIAPCTRNIGNAPDTAIATQSTHNFLNLTREVA